MIHEQWRTFHCVCNTNADAKRGDCGQGRRKGERRGRAMQATTLMIARCVRCDGVRREARGQRQRWRRWTMRREENLKLKTLVQMRLSCSISYENLTLNDPKRLLCESLWICFPTRSLGFELASLTESTGFASEVYRAYYKNEFASESTW